MAVLLVRGSNFDEEINLNTRDRQGKTPLDWISTMTHSKIQNVEAKVIANGGKMNFGLIARIPPSISFLKERDISISSQNDLKPLLKMALDKNFPNVEELIKLGANVNATDQFGNTALHLTSDLKIAKILVKHGALINISNQQNETPITSAINKGIIPIVTMLLNRGAEVTGITKNTKYLHLFGLYYRDGPELMKTLIEKGADIHARDFRKNTVLHLALQKKYFAFASWLIDEKADVNAKNVFEETPLTLAIQKGNFSIARKLMDNGAKACDAIYFLQNVTCQSEAEAYETFVERLIQNGANLDAKDHLGNSALHIASSMGLLKIVTTLLENGIAVDSLNDLYETPLIIACQEGHLKIVNTLLEFGAKSTSINILDFMHENQHKNPHDYASVVTELIKRGACIETRDANENTVLHFAAAMGHSELMKLLIENGCDVNAINDENDTPLNSAFVKGHQSIINLLLENNATANLPNLFQAMPKVTTVDGNDSCSVCFEPKKETFAFQPCGHASACQECCVRITFNEDRVLQKCPICRSFVRDFQRIHVVSLSKAIPKAPKDDCNVSVKGQYLKNGTECESTDILTLLKDIHDMDDQEQTMIVEKMIRHGGMNLQVIDEDQNTALHKTSFKGHYELVKLLIENGCEINAVNADNETPLNLAFDKGHQNIVDLLLKKGANANLPKLFQAIAKISEESDQCFSCFEPKNGIFAFQPCGHANACEQCCLRLTHGQDESLQKCPICWRSVINYQRIYV